MVQFKIGMRVDSHVKKPNRENACLMAGRDRRLKRKADNILRQAAFFNGCLAVASRRCLSDLRLVVLTLLR